MNPESMALIDYLEEAAVEASTSVIGGRSTEKSSQAACESDEAMEGFYLLAFDDEVRRSAASIGRDT